MKGTQVSARYARSLFELALERNELEPVHGDILLLKKSCEESREFRLLLKSPIVQTEKKEHILSELFAGKITPLTLGFILLLARKRREKYIHEIADSFIGQYQDYSNILPVIVKTASPLTGEMQKEMLEVMKKYTDATVEISGSTDPELIGGFILSWKDKQYDASISHEIERLRRAIAKINLYVKEF
jgi:F-type H+-transporting ATPase subunit delta